MSKPQMPFLKEPWVQAALVLGKDPTTSYHLSTSMALSNRLLNNSRNQQRLRLHLKRAMLLKTIFLG